MAEVIQNNQLMDNNKITITQKMKGKILLTVFVLGLFLSILLMSNIVKADCVPTIVNNNCSVLLSSLLTNMVSYHRLDEILGTTAIDAFDGHNGANSGADINQPGKINASYYLYGSDEIDFGTSYPKMTTQTINFWVKGSHTIGNEYFRYTSTSAGFKLQDSITICNNSISGNVFAYYRRLSDGSSLYSCIPLYILNDGNWHMVTFIEEGTTITAYADNVSYGIADAGGLSFVNAAPGSHFYWGSPGSTRNYYLDEIGIWSRPLTEEEITTLWNGGNGLPYDVFLFEILSESHNAGAFEFSEQTFNITVSYPTTVNATFYYDGTPYTNVIKTTSGTNYTFSITINTSEAIGQIEAKNLYWHFTDGAYINQNSPTYTQNIYAMLIQSDNTGGAVHTIDYECYNDNATLIPCTILATYKMWDANRYGLPGVYKIQSLSLYSNSHYILYRFPPNSSYSMRYDVTLSVSALGYTQIFPSYSGEYMYANGTTFTYAFNLSSIANSHDITFQVITIGNQVISNAYLQVDRMVNGTPVLVASGYTDSAGIKTFTLSSGVTYQITAVKSGYMNQTFTIDGSQSFYTITMGTAGGFFNYTSALEGMSWYIYPPSGMAVCLENGVYNYTFQIQSRAYNIYNCSMFIYQYDNNTFGTLLGSAVGCTSPSPTNYGLIYTLINLSNYNVSDRVKGQYFITVNVTDENGTTSLQQVNVESDSNWKCVPTPGNNLISTLKSALKDLTDMPDWGTNKQTTDFSKIVFFFLIVAFLFAILNFYSGYDTAYPGSFLYIVTGLVFIFTVAPNGIVGPGYFYIAGSTNSAYFGSFTRVIDNWIVFVHFLMLSIIYFFTTIKRYQAG